MKIFCHQCIKSTNHIVIAKGEIGSGEHDGHDWLEIHIFAKCAGCDAFTYAIESSSEYDWDPNTGHTTSTWKTYPRGETERQLIEDIDELPSKVRQIYIEIIGSMNAQLPVLSGIGLRALIEAICREQKIPGRNLEKLIDGLATNGVLSEKHAKTLHAHRFLGNVAAHEIVSAQPRELVAAIIIAENILHTIYIIPNLSKKLKTGQKV